MRSFYDVAPDATVKFLTIEEIRKFLEGIVQNTEQVHDSARLPESMSGLTFPGHIADSAAPILTHCTDAFERLDIIGYGDFKSENPKHMIKILVV